MSGFVLNNAHQALYNYLIYIVEFWQYTSSYREQPDVNFLNRLFVQVGGENGGSIWSTFPNLNVLLEAEEIATPVVQVILQLAYMYEERTFYNLVVPSHHIVRNPGVDRFVI